MKNFLLIATCFFVFSFLEPAFAEQLKKSTGPLHNKLLESINKSPRKCLVYRKDNAGANDGCEVYASPHSERPTSGSNCDVTDEFVTCGEKIYRRERKGSVAETQRAITKKNSMYSDGVPSDGDGGTTSNKSAY